MKIARSVMPQYHLIKMLYTAFDLRCLGGFPLWLIGGADIYNDIDLYTNTEEQFNRAVEHMIKVGHLIGVSDGQKTLQFRYNDDIIQIVRPGFRPFTDQELLDSTDLSPSACLLRYLPDEDVFDVLVKYPDDISKRICRVLEYHEWTDYRLDSYRKRGYRIVKELEKFDW